MSGIELIGLLFGAIALIEPIGKSLKSASGIMKSSASFQDYILETSLEYHCAGRAFRNESRRIFGAFLTESQLDDMFGERGSTDPRWQDQTWKDSVKVYLGGFYDEISAAMLLVFRTLSALNDDIVKLTDIDELPKPGEQNGKHGSSSPSNLRESVPVKLKSKLEIKKKDIKKHFDNLQRHNLLYQNEINRFLENQKWNSKATIAIMKANNRRYHLNKSSTAAPWNAVSQVIDNLHEATRRLSFALQRVASCSCHSFHLRLEMVSSTDLSIPQSGSAPCFSNRDPRYQTINFNLITLWGPSLPQPGNCHQMLLDSMGRSIRPTDRLSLRIELKPYAAPKPKTIQTAPLASLITNPGGLTSCLKKPLTAGAGIPAIKSQGMAVISPGTIASQSKFKKTVAFAHNSLMAVIPPSEKKKRKQVEILENPRLKPVLNASVSEENTETSVAPEEILDLCAWLRRVEFSSDTSNQDVRPGVLKGDNNIQYLVYEEKDKYSPEHEGPEGEHSSQNYASLLDYLSSGQDVLSIAQRIELAHTLAISLLRLHSSPWIQRSWSSKDVMLLLPPDATDAERRWSPYVAAAFNDLQEIQEIAQAENENVPGYKLSYVVSLGIIFLEIGLSRSLRDEQKDTLTGDPHFDAYMKACGEVKVHSVNMCMGPIYDRVVEICIKWMDADELDDKLVQQKFYEEVVLGLEKCIKAANSSQERRQQKRHNRDRHSPSFT